MKPTSRCFRIVAWAVQLTALLCASFTVSVANAAVLAPNSIAGKALALTITGAAGEFSPSGQMVMVISDSGEGYSMAELGMESEINEGMCAYTKTGDATARLIVNDGEGNVNAAITFATPTNGTFRATIQGVPGYQTGKFRLFNGTAVSDLEGQNVKISITGGFPTYETNRAMHVQFNYDGTMTQTVVGSTETESGFFSYSKQNRSCGFLEIGGPESGGTFVLLVFADSRIGTFFAFGDEGYETGKFELASPVIVQGLTNITAVAGKKVTLSVRAAGAGQLNYQWFQNGGPVDGATNSTLVFASVGAEQEGSYYVEVSNEFGVVGSNQIDLSLLYPPTILHQPFSLTNYVGSPAMFEVFAIGDEPLRYQWRFNGTPLKGQTASFLTISNVHKANAGSYTVSVTNAYGAAVSSVATLTVPEVYERLTVFTNGLGSVSPNLNGRWFEIGQALTLTANPGPGYLFSNWSGTISSTNRVLAFEMQSNTVLEANFVPNPFIPMKGRYNGLFNDPQWRISGFMSLTVSSNGAFSGTMLLSGRTNRFSGQFDLTGSAEVKVQRTGTPLTNYMHLDYANKWIGGTVTDGESSATLTADLAVFSAANPATNCPGKWTLSLPGLEGSETTPAGDGYALFNGDNAGIVRMTGSLADGTAISQSAPVSWEGYFPCYIPLYNGKGCATGWLRFNSNSLHGSLTWIKPALTNSAFYPGGFTNRIDAAGSKFNMPGKGVRILDFAEGTVTLTDGNLIAPLSNPLTLKTNNIAVVLGTNNLKLTLNRTNGLVQGSFTHPMTRKITAISGVVLQDQNVAAGYFRANYQSGAFRITASQVLE